MDDELFLPGISERERAIRQRVHRLAEFYQHLSIYALVIGGLWIANLVQVWDSGLPKRVFSYWALWPALGWGIGVVVHGISVLPIWNFFSLDWEHRKVQELLARDAARETQTRPNPLTQSPPK